MFHNKDNEFGMMVLGGKAGNGDFLLNHEHLDGDTFIESTESEAFPVEIFRHCQATKTVHIVSCNCSSTSRNVIPPQVI